MKVSLAEDKCVIFGEPDLSYVYYGPVIAIHSVITFHIPLLEEYSLQIKY